MSGLLTIWDSDKILPDSPGFIYLWNGYVESDAVRSLLRYVEEHGERLRRKYLALVHDFGERRFGGKRLIDHFAFNDGLSYWWMTSVVAKDLHKSPITDALRLMALEEIVVQQKPGKLRLVSAERNLHKMLLELCRNLGIDYEWEKQPGGTCRLTRELVYRRLPHLLQALLSLARHWRIAAPFRRMAKPGWLKGDHTVFFCGYFANVVPEQAAAGRFHSRYWEGLHNLMRQLGLAGNWLHHNASPTSEIAMDWVQSFNRNPLEQGFHTFLDVYLSWRIVLRVIRRWLRLSWTSLRLGRLNDTFRPRDSHLSLRPLMKKHWLKSLRGSGAIDNLLSIELFDTVMRHLPHQRIGFYLCEHNEWERALIHAWRKHGHGLLIAVPHSTVRFWDLRFFADQRTLRSPGPYPMPQPDLTALNGRAAVEAYLNAGYSHEAIVECEALRYGYLSDLQPMRTKGNRRGVKRVLILGDILLSSTGKMLQVLEEATSFFSTDIIFSVKPHPLCPVSPDDFPRLKLTVTTEQLGKILADYDIAYSTNITSAGVDAYLAGLPVVVLLDDTALNFSPLRNQSGVRFVSNAEELAEALQSPERWATENSDTESFFFLDHEMPRWRRLLLSSTRT